MRVQSTTLSLSPCVDSYGQKRQMWRVTPTQAALLQELVDRHANEIQVLLWAILGNRTLATEASVEAFARRHGELLACRDPSLELVRRGVAHCRRFRWLAFVCTLLFKPFEPHNEVRRYHAMQLLRRQPWNDRILLVLRDVGGFSIDHIAYVLERSCEDIRTGLLTARRRLLKSPKRNLK